MLLTITTNHKPASDLGYLLHKHPDKCQSFPLSFGQAHVFYPDSNDDSCTVALLLDINPIELVRGKSSSDRREGTLADYVNDRPYVASSFMSVAISQVFRTALSGRCHNRPELVQRSIPLTVNLPVLPCRGGMSFLRQLFEPLGYKVEGEKLPLDETFPEWQDSVYISATLQNTLRLCDLLSHLYVLIPVLDDDKHYWVGDQEIAKLLRHGEGWLNTHPIKEQITQKYLKRQALLARRALVQLTEEDSKDIVQAGTVQTLEEKAIEKPLDLNSMVLENGVSSSYPTLNQQRLELVTKTLKTHQVKRVIDLGCGEGKLLGYLLKDSSFQQIMGVDVSHHTLEIAKKRLKLDNLPFHQQNKIQLIQGSLIYRDRRFQGYDAATVIEVIEHLELNRLAAFEKVLFKFARPKLVIITTPNIEYNVRYKSLFGGLRHQDHRFECTRQGFQDWANHIAVQFAYQVEFQAIGDRDPKVGAPTQMGVFTR